MPLLRETAQFLAGRLMDLDVETRCTRLNSRNGYRDSVWDYAQAISTLSVDDQ